MYTNKQLNNNYDYDNFIEYITLTKKSYDNNP